LGIEKGGDRTFEGENEQGEESEDDEEGNEPPFLLVAKEMEEVVDDPRSLHGTPG
jgi:hypothetical protein